MNATNEPAEGTPAPRSRLAYWALGFGVVLLLHVFYELLSEAPPIWDMAYHQTLGWQYLQAWRSGLLWQRFAELSTYYPPLYYLQEAVLLRLFSYNQFLPLLANLPGLVLLGYATFRLGEHYVGRRYGWIAGLLPLLFPLVAWTSRESLLDVSLSGWVAAGLWLLVGSRMLTDRWSWLLFGLVGACGMLTKWTFVVFLVFPVCYALWASERRRRSVIHLVGALAVGLPPALLWYWPNLRSLAQRFALTSSTGTSLEADPTFVHLSAWIYYPRCLLNYYLFLPLALFFVAGLLLWLFRRAGRVAGLGMMWWTLGGSLLILTLMDAKDPRYVMPMVAPIAILLLLFWRQQPRIVLAIAVVAAFQFLTISFNILGRPVKVAILDVKNDTDYLSLSREWVFYESHYFDAAGPAHREDWHVEEILQIVPVGKSAAFVPDMARFNPGVLQLAALVKGHERVFPRVGNTVESVKALGSFAFVVGKTGPQGISYITPFNKDVYQKLDEQKWPVAAEWPAPDGSRILVWRNPGG